MWGGEIHFHTQMTEVLFTENTRRIRGIIYEDLLKKEKEENEKKQVEIPDVRNLTIKEATKILEEKKLESNLDTDIEVDEKNIVTDMFPKPGVKVNEGSSITLYYNNNK